MRRKRALQGLDDDIRDHIERDTRDRMERGLPYEEARRQALRAFGNVTLVREDTRSVWVGRWAEQLLQDARYAVRLLRRDRTFAVAVILTLAVAIGMNTAVFTVFHAVLLRPLAYPHPERLVWISTIRAPGERGFVTGPDFVDWREQSASFDRMAAYGTGDDTLTSSEGSVRVRAVRATLDFWDLSGVTPAAGRLPAPIDQRAVVLSDAFARRWFGSANAAVGRSIALSRAQVTIVGTLPPDFRFHLPDPGWAGFRRREVDVFTVLVVSPRRGGPTPLLNVVGRLRPDANLSSAVAEVETVRARIEQAHPSPRGVQRSLLVAPLHAVVVESASRALFVLLGAVAFVLVIACANTANLVLARCASRRKEIALRTAIGAGRGRITRQLVAESLVLVSLATALGVALAPLAVRAILRIDPHAIPRLGEATLSGTALAVALTTALAIAVIFGLTPALMLGRMPLHDALKSGKRLSLDRSSVRTRKLVVAGEVALALMLLIGAGLMIKSAWRLYEYKPGFEPARVLTATFQLDGPQYADRQRPLQFAETLLERLRSLPGVESASVSTHGRSMTAGLIVEGDPPASPDDLSGRQPVMINASSADLRRTLGLRLLSGRWFDDEERAAVVNESLAARDLGNRDPIGKQIRLERGGPLFTIVGVAEDMKHSQLDAPAGPEIYVPGRTVEGAMYDFTALILAKHSPEALAPDLRAVVTGIDRTQIPFDVMTLEQRLTQSIAPRRVNLLLLSIFAAVALLLAVVGTYGVLAYSVGQRAPEIGIRMALGAARVGVVLKIVGEGMAPTLCGLAAGVVGARLLTNVMQGLLYDVRATDPWTFIAVTAALGVVGLMACLFPALKAASIDPAIVLREE